MTSEMEMEMEMETERLCSRPGCRFPFHRGTNSRCSHSWHYHNSTYRFTYKSNKNEQKRVLERDGPDGKVPCPCGNVAHFRYNAENVRLNCQKANHAHLRDDEKPDIPETSPHLDNMEIQDEALPEDLNDEIALAVYQQPAGRNDDENTGITATSPVAVEEDSAMQDDIWPEDIEEAPGELEQAMDGGAAFDEDSIMGSGGRSDGAQIARSPGTSWGSSSLHDHEEVPLKNLTLPSDMEVDIDDDKTGSFQDDFPAEIDHFAGKKKCCSVPGCKFPYDKHPRHKSDHHTLKYMVRSSDGSEKDVFRDRPDAKVACFCGSELHARHNVHVLRSICKRPVHPDPTDPVLSLSDKYQDKELEQCRLMEMAAQRAPLVQTQLSRDDPCQMTAVKTVDQILLNDGEPTESTSSIPPTIYETPPASPTLSNIEGISSFPQTSGTYGEENGGQDSHLEALYNRYFQVDNSVQTSDDPSPLASYEYDIARRRLKSYNTFVKPKLHQVICLSCQKIVGIRGSRTHQLGHNRNRTGGRATVLLPATTEFIELLETVGAQEIDEIPPGPLPPLDFVTPFTGWKCLECGHMGKGDSNRYSHMSGHGRSAADTEVVQLIKVGSGFRGTDVFYEVEVQDAIERSDMLLAILETVEREKLRTHSQAFLGANDKAKQNPVFALLRWDELLQNVDVGTLKEMANSTYHASRNSLRQLRKLCRIYYSGIVPLLKQLPDETLTYIRSWKQGQSERQCFQHPQEHGTVTKDADMTLRFLCFLFLANDHPLDGFDVPLHSKSTMLLKELIGYLEDITFDNPAEDPDPDSELLMLLHDVVWSIVATPSPAYIRDASMLQWCLRATTALQILFLRNDYRNMQAAYVNQVQRYLTTGSPVLFTSLRQSMYKLKGIVKQGLPTQKFTWNGDRSVISFDGYPIILKEFFDSFTFTIQRLEANIVELFEGWPYYDSTLDEIKRRTVPLTSHCKEWYTDILSNEEDGFSLFEIDKNGFKTHRMRFLGWMCNNPKYVARSESGEAVGKKAFWDWLGKLDEVMASLYYLILSTGGGGARGTEFENLLYANEPLQQRNIFIVNGLVTNIAHYSKSLALTGHLKRVLRTPDPIVSQYTLLVYGVASFATGSIGFETELMERANAQRYFYHMFLKDGKPLNISQFSKIVGDFNAHAVNVEMKIADYRQFMTAIQVAFVGSAILDPQSEKNLNIRATHALFGRTVAVGRASYGADDKTAAFGFSDDLHSEMQRISLAWHEVIGLAHPQLVSRQLSMGTNGLPTQESSQAFAEKITKALGQQIEALGEKLQAQLLNVKELQTNTNGLLEQLLEAVNSLTREVRDRSNQ
ncbi:hypothetical protein V5O48_018111 [Marasmius crinis-equi]|uniref:C2H2-type domain-containing protein n=1 Tax=Marasmius crinis-equi TaxID=585013 RepID=A0ABR3EM26_9AGAR